MSELSSEGQLIVKLIFGKFDEVILKKDEEISELNKKVRELENRISKLDDSLDSADAYERRDTLIISGEVPEVRPDENCKSLVMDLLRNQTRLIVDSCDISVAHRIGKKPINQDKDTRNIIFKLVRRDLKYDILSACRKIRPKFYINESLTPVRSSIMYTLRKIRKKHPSKLLFCRASEGNVFAFVPRNDDTAEHGGPSRKVLLNTRLALESFIRDEIKESPDSYLDV